MSLSLSQSPRKQSGFTLIELMVVMAIIAILATAGLSAYTGYIKKARDATRIADLAAINTIILGSLSITGRPPQSPGEVHNLIVAANNEKGIFDPLADQTDGGTTKGVCMDYTGDLSNIIYWQPCRYGFRLCDGGMGYALVARFESASNASLQESDNISSTADVISSFDAMFYEIGSCKNACFVGQPGCPLSDDMPYRIWGGSDTVLEYGDPD